MRRQNHNGQHHVTNDATPAAGYLKREQLVGKSVIASNAEIVGTVKDIAAAIDGKVGLHVVRKSPLELDRRSNHQRR